MPDELKFKIQRDDDPSEVVEKFSRVLQHFELFVTVEYGDDEGIVTIHNCAEIV